MKSTEKIVRMIEIQIIGQRESFFRSRDENESFSDSISFIETRPRVPDTYSQASRRDREFLTLTLGHRDEIEIYYLHSQASRREREFPWSDLVFRDETENSETRHLSLKSGLNGLTILHAIFGRLTILNTGPHILLDALDLPELLGFLAFLALLSFRVSFVLLALLELLALLSLHDFLSLHLIPYWSIYSKCKIYQ